MIAFLTSSPEPLYLAKKQYALVRVFCSLLRWSISRHRFQTPFASPPAVGKSSPLINVLWGMANIAIGLLLVIKVAELNFDLNLDRLTFFGGAFLIALVLAWHFGREGLVTSRNPNDIPAFNREMIKLFSHVARTQQVA